ERCAFERLALGFARRRRRMRIVVAALLDPFAAAAETPAQSAPDPGARMILAEAPGARLLPSQRAEHQIADLGAVLGAGETMRQHPSLHRIGRRPALIFERSENFIRRLLARAFTHGRNPARMMSGSDRLAKKRFAAERHNTSA